MKQTSGKGKETQGVVLSWTTGDIVSAGDIEYHAGLIMPGFIKQGEVVLMPFIRRRFWPITGVMAALAAAVLIVLPSEKTIGQVIKIVYLHGALSRAGLVGFVAAGAVGLVYLIRPQPRLAPWNRALLLSGWGFWTAHFIVSMPATRLTWGPWVAWGEPRVTMTLQVIGVGLAVIAVTWLVNNTALNAVASVLMAAALVILTERTGVLRHPLDPISSSPSGALHLTYLILLVPVITAMFLVAWRLTVAGLLQPLGVGNRAAADRTEA